LTIDGTGASITISGGGVVQVMSLNFNAMLSLNEITIANGSSFVGGGIANAGTLTINNSTISGNPAAEYGGCVTQVGSATLVVANSTFLGNTADDGGGAIYGYGTIVVTNSTFANNMAVEEGGAILVDGGTTTITNSTFSGNTAGDPGDGAALYNN